MQYVAWKISLFLVTREHSPSHLATLTSHATTPRVAANFASCRVQWLTAGRRHLSRRAGVASSFVQAATSRVIACDVRVARCDGLCSRISRGDLKQRNFPCDVLHAMSRSLRPALLLYYHM